VTSVAVFCEVLVNLDSAAAGENAGRMANASATVRRTSLTIIKTTLRGCRYLPNFSATKKMVRLTATCNGLHGLFGAVLLTRPTLGAPRRALFPGGDGEHCPKFRSDKVSDGTSCGAKHHRPNRWYCLPAETGKS